MNFIRELVSQKKIRYIDDKFNLDLTYITPRIIAMSYPAEGFESFYRNRIQDVAAFLKMKHKNNFMVFNLSNREYDYTLFDKRVLTIKWPNHYPCPFTRFLEAIVKASQFLLEDKGHVIVVHCIAGKGRTGSFINAILYLSGLFRCITDANSFYLCKRAVYVTYPSQLRYLLYFNHFVADEMKCVDSSPKALTKIIVRTSKLKFFIDKTFQLSFFDFAENDVLLGSIKFSGSDCTFYETQNAYVYSSEFKKWKNMESRDVLCVMTAKRANSVTKLFRVNFNLFFTPETFELKLADLDKVSSKLPHDFSLTLIFTKTFDDDLASKWTQQLDQLSKGIRLVKNALQDGNDRNSFLYG